MGTTYLVTPSLSLELNPTVRVFGAGWLGLFLFNGVLTLVVLAGVWHNLFHLPIPLPKERGLSFHQFISRYWFGIQSTRSWWLALVTWPRERGLIWQTVGEIAAPIVIIAGFVVSLHNLLTARNTAYSRHLAHPAVMVIYTAAILAVIVGFRLFFGNKFVRYKGTWET